MAPSQFELVVLPCICAGALLVVVVCAYLKYRRSASGVSPHDVSSAARHTGSWSSRLRDSFQRNSGGRQETSPKESEEEDGKGGEGQGGGEARELQEIVTPPDMDKEAGEEKGGEEEDKPIQFSPPVSGNVPSLFFDAMTVSLSDISHHNQKSGLVSPNRSPASVRNSSPLEEPPADLEAGLARSKSGWRKSGWRTKLGQLVGRTKSTSSSSRTSSTRSGGRHRRKALSSAAGDGDHDSSTDAMSLATTTTTTSRGGALSPATSPDRSETSRVYTSKELSKATSGFDKRNEIGVGGFGKVYKGFLGNQYMAIKKISANSHQGLKEFVSEVSITGRMRGLRHPNLVPLLGWCQDKGELLLVYSYFPAGSLDRILHSRINPGSNPLSWDRRYKIISDVAAALAFLHSGWAHCVIHRDVKTSNILLDGDKAVLGDFGLARQHNFGQLPLATAPAGTPGYLPPEVALGSSEAERMSDKLDIYSFGVVALEIASGRRPIDYHHDRPFLLDWAWGLHEQDRLIEAADPRLAGHFDTDQMMLVLSLGLLCSHLDPQVRCKMTDVVKYLLRDLVPPPVPVTRPYLTYS